MDLSIYNSVFILPFLTTLTSSFLVSPLVIYLYTYFGWLDDPKTQQHVKVIHTKPVPRGGGIVIFVSLLVGVWMFLGFDKHSIGIVSGAFLLALTGIWDDVKNVNPYLRLGLGLLAGLIVVSSGIGVSFITNPFGHGVIHLNQPQIAFFLFGKVHTIWILADVLALILILWNMNMINWSKGVDGQLPGFVVIAGLVIGVLSLRFTEDVTQWPVSILAAIISGSFLGFLPWNIFPQKMMPGYGAGSLAGYLLAIISILSGAKIATLIIVLGVPMIDAIYVLVRRVVRGQSPVWGDRSHFHHLLLDIGWSKKAIALFYWVITAILGFIALNLNAEQKMYTILMLLVGFGAVLLWIQSLINSSNQSDPDNG